MSYDQRIENARACLKVLAAREAAAKGTDREISLRIKRQEMQVHLSELHRAARAKRAA